MYLMIPGPSDRHSDDFRPGAARSRYNYDLPKIGRPMLFYGRRDTVAASLAFMCKEKTSAVAGTGRDDSVIPAIEG